MTQVVAAVMEQAGRILICQRRADQPHAGKWEFPGGKLEAGESPEAALIRELREELNIDAIPADELRRYEFAYPGKNPILLIFLKVDHWTGVPENRIFERMVWERRERLNDYDFLDGDVAFLRELNCPTEKTERFGTDSATS
jgi:8-oxo-dGTP diphosphatase